jgi:hypothetical protein
MADVLNLGNVTLAVGQQAEFVLTFPPNSPNSLFVVSDSAAIVGPVSAAGTPLTWPHEVALTNGVGSFFLLGASPGVTDYYFRASSDPADTTDIAIGTIAVPAPSAQEQSPEEEIVIQVTAIVEPILITIISTPPTNTATD